MRAVLKGLVFPVPYVLGADTLDVFTCRFYTLDVFTCRFCRTWLLWPTRRDTWNASARPAQKAFAAVANAIARYESVTVGVPPGEEDSARALLGDRTSIAVVVIEQDDAWIRDTGPLFVVSDSVGSEREGFGKCPRQRHVRGVDWAFNAWGGKLGGCFSSWDKDAAIGSAVLRLVNAERYASKMILEVR